MRDSTEREQLLRKLERSRRNLDRSLHSVSHSLDVTHRLETSLRKHSGWWIGGSVIAGIVIASAARPRRKSDESSDRKNSLPSRAAASIGFLRPFLKEIFVLFLPSLKDMALHSLEVWLRPPDKKKGAVPRDK